MKREKKPPTWRQERYWNRGHKRYRPGDEAKLCYQCGNFIGDKYYRKPTSGICRDCAEA